MKKKISMLCLAAICFASNLSAQNTFPATGSTGIGTTTPNASALLEVQSTTQGLLIPRMSKTQRDLIALPATGLMIYQTNNTPGFYYYDGIKWVAVSAKGANTSLSNLVTTSINQSLLPNGASPLNIGSADLHWDTAYINKVNFRDGSVQNTAFVPYTAGAGVDIAGNIITNTNPDKTVVLNNGAGISVTGVYPNFTVASTIAPYTAGTGINISSNIVTNTNPDQTVVLNNGTGISVSGAYPNFTVASTIAPTQWANNGSDIYFNSGKVGIGTTIPLAKLEVAAAMQ